MRLVVLGGLACFWICLIISFILYPNFNFQTMNLSDLGSKASPARSVFNFGLILSAIFIGWFTILSHSYIILSKFILRILLSVFLLFVAVFSVDYGKVHFVISFIFFAISIVLFILESFYWVYVGLLLVFIWAMNLLFKMFGTGHAVVELLNIVVLCIYFIQEAEFTEKFIKSK